MHHSFKGEVKTCTYSLKFLATSLLYVLSYHKYRLKRLKTGGNIQCDHCSKFFDEKKDLKKHISLAHPNKVNEDDAEEIYEDSNNSSNYNCPKCSENFTDLLKLAVHLNSAHERINNR